MNPTNCPCCDSPDLIAVDLVRQADGETTMLQCRDCTALLSARAYLQAQLHSDREIQTTDEYRSDALSTEALEAEIAANERSIQGLCARLGVDPRGKHFLDFGAGRGCAAIAASRRFSKVTATDFNVEAIEGTLSQLGLTDTIDVISDLSLLSERADFFFAWHVLEHIPQPVPFLRGLREKLTDSACLAMQVPKFRAEYVMDCHFVFYNHASIARLIEASGFTVAEVLDDHAHHFLTCLARVGPARRP